MFETPVAVSSAPIPQPAGWRQALPWVAGIVFVIITGIALWSLTRAASATPPVTRLAVALPTGVSISSSRHYRIALSAGGTHLAYAGDDQLYLRALDQIEATPVPRTAGATEPFFSPDGQWIGFWAGDQLKKISVAGGAPVTLCDCLEPYGVSWSPDDTILFGGGEGIWQIPGDGGTPALVIRKEDGEVGMVRPQLLPDGNGSWLGMLPVAKSRSTHSQLANDRC